VPLAAPKRHHKRSHSFDQWITRYWPHPENADTWKDRTKQTNSVRHQWWLIER
jgi:hypothetical protein